MFGHDILVANVIEKGASSRKVYLPAGSRWYDWCDNFACYEGGCTIEIPVTMASIPMFIREGAIIPCADNQIMSMERGHVTTLHLTMTPSRVNSFTLYDDDGVSFEYENGRYRKTVITMTGTDVVNVDFCAEGDYDDFVETVVVEMVRKDKSPFWISLNGKEMEHFLNRHKFEEAQSGWYYSQTKRAVLVKYPNPRQDSRLTVSFEEFDLIGMSDA